MPALGLYGGYRAAIYRAFRAPRLPAIGHLGCWQQGFRALLGLLDIKKSGIRRIRRIRQLNGLRLAAMKVVIVVVCDKKEEKRI